MATIMDMLTDNGTRGLAAAQDEARQLLMVAIDRASLERMLCMQHLLLRQSAEDSARGHYAQVIFLLGEVMTRPSTVSNDGVGGLNPASEPAKDVMRSLVQSYRQWTHKQCDVVKLLCTVNVPPPVIRHCLGLFSKTGQELSRMSKDMYRPRQDQAYNNGIDRGGWAHPDSKAWGGGFLALELCRGWRELDKKPVVAQAPEQYTIMDMFGGK